MRKGTSHAPESRAAIVRAAEYRALLVRWWEAINADTPWDAERRLALTDLARRILVRAPEHDRVRWRRWMNALDRGGRVVVKSYPVKITEEQDR